MKISLLITLILFYSSLISQTSPNFNYQLCLGGSSNDQIYAIDKSKDGGLILGLHSTSSDGDLSFNYGLDDIWIVKLDTLNNITWEKNIGGSSFDYVYSIKETLEGGVIVLGSTSSIDFDVIGNHGSYDIWLVKLDSVGNITWQKCIGGSQTDIGNQIQLLQDSSAADAALATALAAVALAADAVALAATKATLAAAALAARSRPHRRLYPR